MMAGPYRDKIALPAACVLVTVNMDMSGVSEGNIIKMR